jgi:hypothetical protein
VMLGPKFSKMIILALTFVSEFSKDKKTQFTFTFYFSRKYFYFIFGLFERQGDILFQFFS